MLSRTANHLFWMARYIERADHCAAGATVSQANVGAANVKAPAPAVDKTRGCAKHSRFSALMDRSNA
jgi:uncharacterized alpha-E superfamily protein